MAKKDVIDFTGVAKEMGQRGRRIPEGDYECKIMSVEKRWKDNDKTNVPYYNWKFQVANGKEKGAPLYYTTSLKTDALWNLRNLIYAALGRNVAGSKVGFDPSSLEGKTVKVTVADDEYNGKIRSKAVDVQPVGDEEEEEEEELEEEEEEDLEEVDLDQI